MKHVFAVFAVAFFSLTSFAMSTESREDAAEAAASTWLKPIDTGHYDDSWDAASAFFRQRVPRSSGNLRW
jgi:hypothetical protein